MYNEVKLQITKKKKRLAKTEGVAAARVCVHSQVGPLAFRTELCVKDKTLLPRLLSSQHVICDRVQ